MPHRRLLAPLALVLGSALAPASAQAANVTLTGWAFGAGHTVQVQRQVGGSYNGWAGAFGGSLAGAGALDSSSFLTYCIELEESFSFGTAPMTGYTVSSAESYFAARRGDAGIAGRISSLLSFASDLPTRVDTSAESAALQLAIWNLVYDTDWSVSSTSAFRDGSSLRGTADQFLAGASAYGPGRFQVFALSKAGSQDFLAVLPRNDVPEPGSLGLAAAALGALALAALPAARRRRAQPAR